MTTWTARDREARQEVFFDLLLGQPVAPLDRDRTELATTKKQRRRATGPLPDPPGGSPMGLTKITTGEAERLDWEERTPDQGPATLACPDPDCDRRWTAPTHYGEIVDDENCPGCGKRGDRV